jgi:hypothetical protein
MLVCPPLVKTRTSVSGCPTTTLPKLKADGAPVSCFAVAPALKGIITADTVTVMMRKKTRIEKCRVRDWGSGMPLVSDLSFLLDRYREGGNAKTAVSAVLSLMSFPKKPHRRARESLTTVQKHNTPLAEATTSSLEALKAYSAGWKIAASKALELLQPAAPYELGSHRSSFSGLFGNLYPIYVRGEAYLAAHRGAEAAAEFQKIIEHRGIVVSDPIGALAFLQLARAYSISGGPHTREVRVRRFPETVEGRRSGNPSPGTSQD